MDDRSEFEIRVEHDENQQTDTDPGQFRQEVPGDTRELVDRIKEIVRKGNIARIIIKKGEHVFVDIPLNVGIVGSIFGAAAAPWAVIAAAVATIGFDCVVELVKIDGEVIDLSPRTLGKRMADVGTSVVDGLKNVVGGPADDPAPWDQEPPAAPWDEGAPDAGQEQAPEDGEPAAEE